MTFHSFDTWWWPFLFILLAGSLTTDCWRFLGVYLGDRLSEKSEVLVFVRTVATALVAGVISNLVLFPSGALAATPVALRIMAMIAGFVAYLCLGRKIIVGIAAAEIVFFAGYYLLGV